GTRDPPRLLTHPKRALCPTPAPPPPATPADDRFPQSEAPPTHGPDPPEDPDVVAKMESFLGTMAAGRQVTGWAGSPGTVPDVPPRSQRIPPPSHIAGYEVLGVLGRGGMGVVYKALQPGLKRLVALNVVPPRDPAAPDPSPHF